MCIVSKPSFHEAGEELYWTENFTGVDKWEDDMGFRLEGFAIHSHPQSIIVVVAFFVVAVIVIMRAYI